MHPPRLLRFAHEPGVDATGSVLAFGATGRPLYSSPTLQPVPQPTTPAQVTVSHFWWLRFVFVRLAIAPEAHARIGRSV